MLKSIVFALLLIFNCTQLLSQPAIVINEISASNYQCLYDEDKDSPDWIELYNTSDSPVNINNYRISNKKNYETAWIFPDTLILPKSHLVIFASGKNRINSDKYLVKASGYAFAQINDGFRFDYLELDDDFDVSVSIDAIRSDNDSAMCGLVVRNGLGAGDPMIGIFCNNDYKDNAVLLHRGKVGQSPAQKTQYMPFDLPNGKLRLKKQGDTVYAYVFINGYEWYDIIRLYFKPASDFYVGIACADSSDTAFPGFSFSDFYLNDNAVDFDNLQSIDINTGKFGKSFLSNELHTNFKLGRNEGSVYLWLPDGSPSDSIIYEYQFPDITYGRIPDGESEIKFLSPATPNAGNKGGFTGITPKPEFSIDGGWFGEPVEVEMNSEGPGTKIYYSIGADLPDSSSLEYSTPVLIDSTTVIRAIAYQKDHLPSKVRTRTFFINDNINNNNNNEKSRLPVFSVNVRPGDLWNSAGGIFNRDNSFYTFEVPAHFEYWSNKRILEYSSDAGIKLHGNTTKFLDHRPFRLYARNYYQDKKFDYNFFPSLKSGKQNGYKPDKLILRNAGQDWFFSYFRDGLFSILANEMSNIISASYSPCNVFLNGSYYGILNLRNKIDAQYLSARYNIPASSINLLENQYMVINGTYSDFHSLYLDIKELDVSSQSAYNYIDKHIDIRNIVDYAIIEVYSSNVDWSWNNIKFWNSTAYDGKWRWIVKDMDLTFGLTYGTVISQERIEPNMNFIWGILFPIPDLFVLPNLFSKIIKNKKIKNYFINRLADLLNSTLSDSHVISKIDSIKSILEPEIGRHISRWDSSAQNWEDEIEYMKYYASARPDVIRRNLKNHYELPGYVDLILSTNIRKAGKINISTLTIEEFPWSGIYFRDVPVSIEAVPYDGYRFVKWIPEKYGTGAKINTSLPKVLELTAVFEPASGAASPVVINEIMYRPGENDCGDWIELYNNGGESVDLSQWRLKDNNDEHFFEFPDDTMLKSDDYLVIVRDSAGFSQYHPAIDDYLCCFDFGYGREDQVKLFDGSGGLIDIVSYTNVKPWQPETDGTGRTLELIHPSYDNSLPESWQASYVPDGTPDSVNSVLTSVDYPASGNDSKLICFPNPTSQSTAISYGILRPTNVKLKIINSLGSVKAVLVEEYQGSGRYTAKFDASSLLPGLYVCRLETGYGVETVKVVVVR